MLYLPNICQNLTEMQIPWNEQLQLSAQLIFSDVQKQSRSNTLLYFSKFCSICNGNGVTLKRNTFTCNKQITKF